MLSRYSKAVQVIVIIVLTLTMYSGCGNEGDTIYITSYEVPGIPVNIQAVAGDSEVTISWNPVEGATSYNIYWNTTGSVTRSDSAIISATSPYTHTGLTNDTTYYYIVTAINVEGEGEISSEASATPEDSTILNPPPAPTGVTATAADSQVTISWSPVEGATSYNIYWNTTGTVTISDTAIISAPSPYIHMDLTNGTTYYYAVTAINNDGASNLSAEVTVTPEAPTFPPSVPTNVQATRGDEQVTISWSPVEGATSYNIYWNTTGGVTTSDSVIANASPLYVQTNLINHTTYYYVVTAVNASGESEVSAEVSAMPRMLLAEAVQKVYAPDAQAGDRFGYSVSISGDYAIVGSRSESAYIFHMSAPDLWDGGTKIVAPDADAVGFFGSSVSIDGDYAIVGEHGNYGCSHSLTNSGAAYIFHRTGPNTWDGGTKIVAPDAQLCDSFGYSVSISGDYAIVGAPVEDGGINDPLPGSGAAYIFHRTGPNTWDGGTKIVAPDAQAGDLFGYSVAINEDHAIIGAPGEDGGAGDSLQRAGAAYMFHRTGPNTWDGGTKVVAFDARANCSFGGSVAVDGDYAIVGAKGRGSGVYGEYGAGAAYIFRKTGTATWDGGTKVIPFEEQPDYFGISVSIRGDYAVVGTTWGVAYVFLRTGQNSWDEGARTTTPIYYRSDGFGRSVSISGNHAIIAAEADDAESGKKDDDTGAVYFY